MVKEFADFLGIQAYGRFDFRCMCHSSEQMKVYMKDGITWDILKFVEVNALPTIKENVNFLNSLENITSNTSISKCLECYYDNVRNGTLTGFILSSSILSFKATH